MRSGTRQVANRPAGGPWRRRRVRGRANRDQFDSRDGTVRRGATAAAMMALTASSGTNGVMPSASARATLPLMIASHESPPISSTTLDAIAAPARPVNVVARFASVPATNAATGYAYRYPAVGPRKRSSPGAPYGENTGRPAAPAARYRIMLVAPATGPSQSPASA